MHKTLMFKTLAVAGITATASLGSGAGDLLEGHSVSLSTMVAVGSVVLPAAWWLSNKFTKIDDSLKVLKEKLDNLPCNKGSCSNTKSHK